METILNKVEQSGIVSINLEDGLTDATIQELDLAPILWQGMVLKETDFRQFVKEHPWNSYTDAHVGVFCSADAIIPMWAYMLVSSALHPFAKSVVAGNANDVKNALVMQYVDSLSAESLKDTRVVVKGCGSFESSPAVFMALTRKLQPVVKSLMFGEPCSTVPIYKVPRK
ncbi:MAG: hypothetical protein RL226_197 [Bacteroidota bacterium]